MLHLSNHHKFVAIEREIRVYRTILSVMCDDETHIYTKKKAILKKKKNQLQVRISPGLNLFISSSSWPVFRATTKPGICTFIGNTSNVPRIGALHEGSCPNYRCHLMRRFIRRAPLDHKLCFVEATEKLTFLKLWALHLTESEGCITIWQTCALCSWHVKLKGDMFRNSEMKHQWCKQHFSS